MKKVLLFLLLSTFTFGQDISPYYPARQESALRGNEPTQFTYYDSSFVQSVIPNFCKNTLGMSQIDVKADSKNNTYTQIYQDMFSTGKLYFDIHIDIIESPVQNPEIVKSLKIYGTPKRVISFFVRYWHTDYDFDSLKSDVERKHMQDKVQFFYNKGKPYILIKNSTYNSSEDFTKTFNELLLKNPATL